MIWIENIVERLDDHRIITSTRNFIYCLQQCRRSVIYYLICFGLIANLFNSYFELFLILSSDSESMKKLYRLNSKHNTSLNRMSKKVINLLKVTTSMLWDKTCLNNGPLSGQEWYFSLQINVNTFSNILIQLKQLTYAVGM